MGFYSLISQKILHFSRENGGERYSKRFNCMIHLVRPFVDSRYIDNYVNNSSQVTTF